LKNQTYSNYELIIVDDYEPRYETTDVPDYMEEKGVNLAWYGASKKKYYPDTYFGQVNALNTGLLQASGDIVVIVEDYMWIPPTSLEQWNQVYNRVGLGFFITAVGVEWTYKPPENLGNITTWDEEFMESDFSKCTVTRLWMPGLYRGIFQWGDEWDWHYSAFPMEAIEKMNGIDERFDHHNLFPSMFFPLQVKMNGYHFYPDADNIVYVIDHRSWHFGWSELWHIKRPSAKTEKVLLPFDKVFQRSPNGFDLATERRKNIARR